LFLNTTAWLVTLSLPDDEQDKRGETHRLFQVVGEHLGK